MQVNKPIFVPKRCGPIYWFPWLIVALLVFSTAGCGREATSGSDQQRFAVANGLVEFTFPAGWYENEEQHPFDLQCFSKDQRMNTGVFLYAKEDQAQDISPRDLLEQHIQDLRSKRKNFKMLEEERVVQLPGKTLTTVVYSGEKDSSKSYYRFTLIEFAENSAPIPIVLQVSVPSTWNENRPDLEAITASAHIQSTDSQDHK